MRELEDEGAVKITETHERSYLFDGCRGWPVCYSLNSDRVHVRYPLFKD